MRALCVLAAVLLLAACEGGGPNGPLQPPTGSVQGSVVNDSGAAAAGIAVQIVGNGQPARSAFSNINGTFTFENVPPGNYMLYVLSAIGIAGATPVSTVVSVASDATTIAEEFVVELIPLGEWALRAPLLEANSEYALTELNGKIYAIGGYPFSRETVRTVQVYDIATNTWAYGPQIPAPNNHGMAAAVNGKVYLIGGQLTADQEGYVNTVYELDPAVGVWVERAPMPTMRSGGVAVVLGGKIYVAGGRVPQGADFAVFDPAANTWQTLPSLPTQRNHVAGVAINGRIHILGGRLGNGLSPFKTTAHEVYDPGSNQWTTAAPMLSGRSGINGVMAKGCLHVWGGEAPTGMTPQHEFYSDSRRGGVGVRRRIHLGDRRRNADRRELWKFVQPDVPARRRVRVMLRLGVVVAVVHLLACSDPAGHDGPAELTLVEEHVAVMVGAARSLNITVRNSNETPQLVSRDEAVAVITAQRAIQGISVGETYVVATLPSNAEVRDSVRVVVMLPAIDSCAIGRPVFDGPAAAEDRMLFAYDASAPLNFQKSVQSTADGVRVSTITFSSPAGGTVAGIFAEPISADGSRPGMVLLPPGGAGATAMIPYAKLLAQDGAVVIAIDAPYVRRGGTSVPLFTAQDRVEQIQLIKDLQRAVDVLIAQPSVDAERIGFEGYSYGGIFGAQFIGIERRLKAAVIAAAHGGHITGITSTNNLNWFLTNVPCSVRLAWFEAMMPIEPIRYIANAPPTEVLFQIAQFDAAVLPADALALYLAASEPKDVMTYATGHSFNPQAILDRRQWLSDKLGLDPPT
jgi:dienelactone hydrolase/N-acetylneuraminic acid mutarotase